MPHTSHTTLASSSLLHLPTARVTGLSKLIAFHGSQCHWHYMKILQSVNKAEHIQEAKECCVVELQGLPPEVQDAAKFMYADQGMDVVIDEPTPFMSADSDSESDYGDNDEFAKLSKSMSGQYIFKVIWNIQMPLLVDAYLDYHSCDTREGFPSADDLMVAAELPVQLPPGSISNIELVDIFTCFYHLEDEHRLKFDWLVSTDGNNSLKWQDTMVYGKTPHEDSFYEVKAKQKQTVANNSVGTEPNNEDDWEMDVDVASSLFNCVDCWHNAKSDQCKKMFSVFEESGIFIVTC
ncbi:hypothetical protein EDC04DRAFT_2611075 [Pisolithus marmoratus]|nr:hypothetical protein EDC04DRAFT_2611075 [Pisolithus marmoratus]